MLNIQLICVLMCYCSAAPVLLLKIFFTLCLRFALFNVRWINAHGHINWCLLTVLTTVVYAVFACCQTAVFLIFDQRIFHLWDIISLLEVFYIPLAEGVNASNFHWMLST